MTSLETLRKKRVRVEILSGENHIARQKERITYCEGQVEWARNKGYVNMTRSSETILVREKKELLNMKKALKELKQEEEGILTSTKITEHGGDLMTLAEFKKNVKEGNFTDYDGYGKYSDGEVVYNRVVDLKNLNKKYSHVLWFNK